MFLAWATPSTSSVHACPFLAFLGLLYPVRPHSTSIVRAFSTAERARVIRRGGMEKPGHAVPRSAFSPPGSREPLRVESYTVVALILQRASDRCVRNPRAQTLAVRQDIPHDMG